MIVIGWVSFLGSLLKIVFILPYFQIFKIFVWEFSSTDKSRANSILNPSAVLNFDDYSYFTSLGLSRPDLAVCGYLNLNFKLLK